jgi:hypothetical protein
VIRREVVEEIVRITTESILGFTPRADVPAPQLASLSTSLGPQSHTFGFQAKVGLRQPDLGPLHYHVIASL